MDLQAIAEVMAYFGISGATVVGIVIAIIRAYVKQQLDKTDLDERLVLQAENYARRLESFDSEVYSYLETFVQGAWDRVKNDKELHDTVKRKARDLINDRLVDYDLGEYQITDGWIDDMVDAIADEKRRDIKFFSR